MSEENKETKFDQVLEGYRPMTMGRMFYPRGMKLSEDFVNAFHREYDRLVSEGQNPKSLLERFGKALKFHVSETRKYPELDARNDQVQKEFNQSGGNFEDVYVDGKGWTHMTPEEAEAYHKKKKAAGKKKTTKFGKQLQKWADDDS